MTHPQVELDLVPHVTRVGLEPTPATVYSKNWIKSILMQNNVNAGFLYNVQVIQAQKLNLYRPCL